MKRWMGLFFVICLLSGCAAEETLETVQDEWMVPAMAHPREISVRLPEDLVMPVLEQLVDIRDPYIQIDVDFDASKTALHGEAGLSIRIGTLLAAAFGIGIPALRWFLRMQKQQKTEETQAPAAPVAAGETVE